jgi:hypothetical protein
MNGDSYLVLDYSTYRRQLKAKRVSEDITNAVQNVDLSRFVMVCDTKNWSIQSKSQ